MLGPVLRATFDELDFYDFVKAARLLLRYTSVQQWAEVFVYLRMLFGRRCGSNIYTGDV